MEYLLHLRKDKKLSTIIVDPLPRLQTRKNIALHLISGIMSQQLNTKVADIIYQRFLLLFDGKEPTAKQIAATPPEQLRAIGLSNAKVSYVHNVAAFCLEHKITDKKLLLMADEEIIELLTRIKGVGKWTVEMLLMFTLGREDIFSADDYGVQSAIKKLYKLDDSNKKLFKEKMLKISAKWSPYRTYACVHLWKWKDNVPDIIK